MNTPSTFPRSLVAALLLSASFAMAHAADPAVSDESPIPPVVRARLAEAAKGAGLHDYSVDQRAGGVVYTAGQTPVAATIATHALAMSGSVFELSLIHI